MVAACRTLKATPMLRQQHSPEAYDGLPNAHTHNCPSWGGGAELARAAPIECVEKGWEPILVPSV